MSKPDNRIAPLVDWTESLRHDERDFDSLCHRFLETLIGCLDATTGALWRLSPDQTSECIVFVSTTDAGTFQEQSLKMRFAPGTGMPGRVLAVGKAEVIEDVIRDDNFPRLRGAIKDGLHGAVGFPIVRDGVSIGVAEAFSRAALVLSQEELSSLSAVGRRLGEHPLFYTTLSPPAVQ